MNAKTRRHAPIALLILASALALTACASTGTTTTTASTPPPASSAAPAVATSAVPAPSPSAASTAICTSHACIVSSVQQSLTGLVAKDESVITKAVCYKSTVKNPDQGIYTVSCLATYSDGSQWDGIATVLLSQSQVTWEPTTEA